MALIQSTSTTLTKSDELTEMMEDKMIIQDDDSDTTSDKDNNNHDYINFIELVKMSGKTRFLKLLIELGVITRSEIVDYAQNSVYRNDLHGFKMILKYLHEKEINSALTLMLSLSREKLLDFAVTAGLVDSYNLPRINDIDTPTVEC